MQEIRVINIIIIIIYIIYIIINIIITPRDKSVPLHHMQTKSLDAN